MDIRCSGFFNPVIGRFMQEDVYQGGGLWGKRNRLICRETMHIN